MNSCDPAARRPTRTGQLFGPGRLWLIDVSGKRLVIDAQDFPGSSDADRAELQRIVDSIRID